METYSLDYIFAAIAVIMLFAAGVGLYVLR